MNRNYGRIFEIGEYVDEHGKADAAIHFDIKPESIKRYYTYYQDAIGRIETRDQENVTIKRLLDRFTPKELKSIADGKSLDNSQQYHPVVNFEGDEFTALFITDSHWGAKHSPVHYWESALEEGYKQGATRVFHGGDMVEGMSNRPDHVYSLSHIGYSAQMDLAEELLSMSELPVDIIAGNHDLWGVKSGGIEAVKDVAKRLDHVNFLGNDMGVIKINGTEWMLHHGRDGGGSYAISYRPQKIIEAFTGGEKPHVLMTGHDHKSGYFFERNVHAVLGGALCKQSQWMKATRKANKDGFWILKAGIGDGEIKYFSPRWYPFY
jgi:hypothetical protein